MKRKLLVTALIVIMLTASFVPFVYAEDDSPGTSDKFVTGENVDITSSVNGDLYAAGNYVTIDGDISGDLLTGGNTIIINSDVDQNIRAGGNFITLNNVSARNMTIFGQIIRLNQVDANNLYLFGQSVLFSGKAHDVFLNGNKVTIDGIVAGNSEVNANSVIITENAEILGTLNVRSNNEISYQGTASDENVTFTKTNNTQDFNSEYEKNNYPFTAPYRGLSIFRVFVKFMRNLATIFVTGLVILLVFPNPTKSAIDNLKTNTFKPVLLGLVIFAAVPVLTFLAMLTIIGIPLSFATSLVFVLVLILAKSFTALAVTDVAFPKLNKYLGLLLSALIISFLSIIPIVNFLVWLIAVGYTFGSLILVFKKEIKIEEAPEEIESEVLTE